jgi:ABC-type bacteriocin/lantibiotic exporter with double-glycine peptidase domain
MKMGEIITSLQRPQIAQVRVDNNFESALEVDAVAFAHIASYYGVQVSAEDIQEAAGSDGDRMDSVGFGRAAAKIGFDVVPVGAGLDDLLSTKMPVLIRIATPFEHLAVLHRVNGNDAIIFDPTRGLRIFSVDALSRIYRNEAFKIIPPPRDF